MKHYTVTFYEAEDTWRDFMLTFNCWADDEDTDPIPEALDALGRVERLVACRKAKTFPLPWDNQAEYGRRYLERNT